MLVWDGVNCDNKWVCVSNTTPTALLLHETVCLQQGQSVGASFAPRTVAFPLAGDPQFIVFISPEKATSLPITLTGDILLYTAENF